MSARKKVAKKKVAKKKPVKAASLSPMLDAAETHAGQVIVTLVNNVGGIEYSRLSRDEAALGAIRLIISICGLSTEEVRKALAR